MSLSRQMPEDTRWLTKLIERHQLPTHALGMCFGMTAMAIVLGLAEGDVSAIQDQLWLLIDMYHHPEQLISAEMKTFLKNIALFQLPKLFKDSLPPSDSYEQSISQYAEIIAPDNLKTQGGLRVTDEFVGAYSLPALKNHFKGLAYAISKKDLNKPMFLLLRNIVHALATGYDPASKKWFCINLASMNKHQQSKPITFFDTPEKLAKNIFDNFNSVETAVISTKVCATNEDTESIRKITQIWQKDPNFKATHQATNQQTDHLGTSVLLLATVENNIETVRAHLLNGADINQSLHESGTTALYLAAKLGHADLTTLLLEKGANPNLLTGRGDTPLIGAIENNYEKTIFALLKNKTVNPDFKDGQHLTPLYQATHRNLPRVVKLLLEAGANPEIECHRWSPIRLAKHTNNPTLLSAFSLFKTPRPPVSILKASSRQINGQAI